MWVVGNLNIPSLVVMQFVVRPRLNILALYICDHLLPNDSAVWRNLQKR